MSAVGTQAGPGGWLGPGLVLLASCSASPPPRPQIASVSPAQAQSTVPVSLHVYGSFPMRRTVDLDQGTTSPPAPYRAWLNSDGGGLELPPPVPDGGGELIADLGANQLAPGDYGLTLEDPWQQRLTFDHALRLDPGCPPDGCDAGSPDAGDRDAGNADAGVPDAGACAAGCGPRSACVRGVCTPARRTFVSSTAFLADFGGAPGADTACQNLANTRTLGGTWRAWVSDSANSPSTRFVYAAVPYRLLDSVLVAANGNALTRRPLAHGIDLDEQGAVRPNAEVWTATNPDGTFAGNGCNDFTSKLNGATPAAVGLSDRTDFNWTHTYLQFCDRTTLRLYCVEQ